MQDLLDLVDWNKCEIIPTIAQEQGSGEVLMLAYSSRESLELSLQTHIAHYFSRSKGRVWQKGEQSGNIQHIKEIKLDCDNDSLLFIINQTGVACHTGAKSCFFRQLEMGKSPLQQLQSADTKGVYHILDELYHTIQSRKTQSADKSYSASLFAKGANGISKKIIEEAGEFCFALKDNKREDIIYECADLFYHTLVGLALANISPECILQELQRRTNQSGIDEKASRTRH